MGSLNEELKTEPKPVYGTIKFLDPDLSVGPHERALFALPPPKEYRFDRLPLHNYRTEGPTELDHQGFTLVYHKSSVSGARWFDESVIKNTYIPEVQELMKKATGAKSVVAINVVYRRKVAQQEDTNPKSYMKKGQGLDLQMHDIDHDHLACKSSVPAVLMSEACRFIIDGRCQ